MTESLKPRNSSSAEQFCPRRIGFLEACLLAVFCSISVACSVESDWLEKTPMPTARSEMSAAFLDGRIYVPGGLGVGSMRTFEAYDVARDSWDRLPMLPAGRHHLMTAAFQGQFYVFGGADANWSPTATAWVYDPENSQWHELPPMPEPRSAASAVVLDGLIYIVGGDGPSDELLRYDPQARMWVSLAPTKERREHTAAVAFHGHIIVLGGRFRGKGELRSVEIYDIASNTWRAGPSLQVARGGHAAFIYDQRIIVAGGEVIMTDKQTLSNSEQLRELSATWQQGPSLPLPLHGFAAVATDTIFVIGGSERAGAATNRGRVFKFIGAKHE